MLVFKTKSETSKTCLKGTCLIYQKRRLLWQQVSKESGKTQGIKIPARDDISSSEEDKRLGIWRHMLSKTGPLLGGKQ